MLGLNNKGFAITASIYGFMLLFIMVLLFLLNSITNSDSVYSKVFESVEDSSFYYTYYEFDDTVLLSGGNIYNTLNDGVFVYRVNGTGSDYCMFLPSNTTIFVRNNSIYGMYNGNEYNMSSYMHYCDNNDFVSSPVLVSNISIVGYYGKSN